MNGVNYKGVSVIICCYNSANRIKETLEALGAQEFENSIPWEIILVDNASTDNTAEIATAIWKEINYGNNFRVVTEPTPGLANARKKGISEARFSILLFCDDDNHLCPNYAEGVYNILHNHPEIAACGGKGIPLFNTKEPAWFSAYHEAYAVGSQLLNKENGKQLNLYGAGMAIQKQAFENLNKAGFASLLQDRTGTQLSSAGDTEMTYAFVLMGYQLHYTADLTFYHYLPPNRLTKKYLTKLFTAFGSDGPIRNLYYAHISDRFFHKNVINWYFHLLLSLYRLMKYLIIPPKKQGRIIYLNWNLSYLRTLYRLRRNYKVINKNIARLKHTVPKMYAIKGIRTTANYSQRS
jgi:glycosyltransferase involved in cell wall biosynthesis